VASDLIINSTPVETRVALVENGVIIDLLIERERDKGLVGSIYKGRILRVLPGMQACFVDIGLDRAAFLYVDDILTDAKHGDDLFFDDDEDDKQDETAEKKGKTEGESKPQIQDLVKEGQELLVQVLKTPSARRAHESQHM
jgi:ribonuclease G